MTWRRFDPLQLGLLAALSCVMAVVLVPGGPLPVDVALSLRLQDPGLLARVLMTLGTGWVVLPALLAVCLWRCRAPAAFAPVVLLLVVQGLESVLTGPLLRTEPLGTGPLSSGQTLTAVLGWGLVAHQMPRLRRHAFAVGALALPWSLSVLTWSATSCWARCSAWPHCGPSLQPDGTGSRSAGRWCSWSRWGRSAAPSGGFQGGVDRRPGAHRRRRSPAAAPPAPSRHEQW